LTEQLKEWIEADGTIYRLNADGNYDVIPPTNSKSKAKAKPKAKKSKKVVGGENHFPLLFFYQIRTLIGCPIVGWRMILLKQN